MEKFMYKISFYVPEQNVDKVKQAMFTAGAGRLGNYDHTAWQTLGTGQFRPLEGSNPSIGESNAVNYVSEYKVEMLCESQVLSAVIDALKNSHPYETPAFDIIKIENAF
jgi:hypothetical protein